MTSSTNATISIELPKNYPTIDFLLMLLWFHTKEYIICLFKINIKAFRRL